MLGADECSYFCRLVERLSAVPPSAERLAVVWLGAVTKVVIAELVDWIAVLFRDFEQRKS